MLFAPRYSKCVVVYIDDIVIYSKTREEHLKDFEEVFMPLHKHRLLTKGSKCDFLKDRLEFAGHAISTKGVEVDPRKIETVQAWRLPKILHELQSFSGFVNNFRKFIPNMGGPTSQLTDLLRKGTKYRCGEKEQVAFSALKTFMFLAPVLCIADPYCPFEVITHANDIAIGAELLQDFGEGLQSIAYELRKLHPPEQNYPIHDKEMLAIVQPFKVWWCYLKGVDVTVRTGHRNLQYIHVQLLLNP
ncbi:hypothetical protein CLOM_g16150 [Closterium sp. NIES-68]|nr:hypothetical protein CLOM_g16150 [Closterium sp. NIES-68]